MRKLFALLMILISPVLLIAQDKPAVQNRSVVFRNVTLIDMRSEQPQPDMTVVIKGNRISKIGKNVKIPKNAEVIDASGKFLIPGLWDNYTFTLEAVKNNPIFRVIDCSRRNGRAGCRNVF